ncbi:MAG: hypothetical protein WAW85_01605 [Gordonia sp. (in: high G+C Gram-positive bacteria)]|uniref:hypothetical protein n=1 Tax=Gordonia sp. (in: high G+C Gram-positive bacteria) TaxID=84139 RepID=UPI003BB5B22C
MQSPNPATDRLLYAAWEARTSADWVTDTAGDHGHHDDCCTIPLDTLDNARGLLVAALAEFTTYSDGRPIRTTVEIEYGHRFSYTWTPTPDPRPGPIELCRGELARDDAHRSNGRYIMWAWPDHCQLKAQLLTRPRLRVVH